MISVKHSDFELNGIIVSWSIAIKNRRLDEIDRQCHKQQRYLFVRQQLIDYQDQTFWVNTRHLPPAVLYSSGEADYLREKGVNNKRYGMSDVGNVLHNSMPFDRRSVKKYGRKANKYYD